MEPVGVVGTLEDKGGAASDSEQHVGEDDEIGEFSFFSASTHIEPANGESGGNDSTDGEGGEVFMRGGNFTGGPRFRGGPKNVHSSPDGTKKNRSNKSSSLLGSGELSVTVEEPLVLGEGDMEGATHSFAGKGLGPESAAGEVGGEAGVGDSAEGVGGTAARLQKVKMPFGGPPGSTSRIYPDGKQYWCPCGKRFRNALGLGGHKATCKASFGKDGSVENLSGVIKKRARKMRKLSGGLSSGGLGYPESRGRYRTHNEQIRSFASITEARIRELGMTHHHGWHSDSTDVSERGYNTDGESDASAASDGHSAVPGASATLDRRGAWGGGGFRSSGGGGGGAAAAAAAGGTFAVRARKRKRRRRRGVGESIGVEQVPNRQGNGPASRPTKVIPPYLVPERPTGAPLQPSAGSAFRRAAPPQQPYFGPGERAFGHVRVAWQIFYDQQFRLGKVRTQVPLLQKEGQEQPQAEVDEDEEGKQQREPKPEDHKRSEGNDQKRQGLPSTPAPTARAVD